LKWRKQILGDIFENIKKYSKETLKCIKRIAYPARCPVCGRVLPAGEERDICKGCTGKIEYVGNSFCMKCGKPASSDTEFCLDCTKKNTSYICGRAVFVYNRYMKQSFKDFKYNSRTEYARFYAREAFKKYGEWIKGISPDAFIPVPIHENRKIKRGYNQALLIAELLGELTGIRVINDLIIRSKDTSPQKELRDKERKRNLYNAFEAVKESRELYHNLECVIIIDDIYTTGSTIEECSYVLKSVHIDSIYFLCICTGKGY